MIRPNASTTFALSRPAAGRAAPRGVTLVEMLLTLVIISILAALLIPQLGQQIPDQLTAVSEIVASDLEYTRSLAVVNNSTYRLTFEPAANRYSLRHSGTNTLLHVLPSSPFRQTTDLPDQQTTDLADLPLARPPVRLLQVVTDNGSVSVVGDIEFTALGGTTRSSTTVVWLACGEAAERRYISIEINPTTGLVEIGPLAAGLPGSVAAVVVE